MNEFWTIFSNKMLGFSQKKNMFNVYNYNVFSLFALPLYGLRNVCVSQKRLNCFMQRTWWKKDAFLCLPMLVACCKHFCLLNEDNAFNGHIYSHENILSDYVSFPKMLLPNSNKELIPVWVFCAFKKVCMYYHERFLKQLRKIVGK